MSPPIAQLPVELLLNIADHHHTTTARDLNALALTCRGFYSILNPMLYAFNVKYQGASAALWAARHGRIDKLEMLCDLGADLETVRDEQGWSFGVMSMAAEQGQDATLSWILARTAYVRHQLTLDMALFRVTAMGRFTTCGILVAHGARNRYDKTEVRRALMDGRVDVAKALAVCTPLEEMAALFHELKAIRMSTEESGCMQVVEQEAGEEE